jgi:hypothetical protein
MNALFGQMNETRFPGPTHPAERRTAEAVKVVSAPSAGMAAGCGRRTGR